jgi:hypothetical protein
MNAFELLGITPQAAIDEATLKQAYFTIAKTARDNAELHAAYQTLLYPEKRLKHLLEITAPPNASNWRTVPIQEELMQLFLLLGKESKTAETLITKKSNTSSALGRALLEKQLLAQRDALEGIGFQLEDHKQSLVTKLHLLEGEWQSLAMIQAQLSYISKWQTQVAELLLKLI